MKRSPTKQTAAFWIVAVAILILSFVNGFLHLTDGGVNDWDEARHGVNAYEMVQSGNYIVHTYDGQVDYWNVKPPLSIWSVALSYRVFGYNLLGLRFFSALCLPVVTCVSMLFLKRYLGPAASIGTGLLFAVTGTRFHHLFQTGDPDALFLTFCLLACIFLYLSLCVNSNYLVGVGLCTALGFLAKAMHVAPLVLVIGCTLLVLRKSAGLRWRDVLVKLLIPMALPVLLWAVARFSQDGIAFFRQMIVLDVLNRVGSVVESHSGGFGYYFIVLRNLMGPWVFWGILLTMLCVVMLELISDSNPPRDRGFLVVFINMLLWPLLLFTIAKTKLAWYGYPALIGYYFLAGYAFQRLVDISVADSKRRNSARAVLIGGAAVIAVGLCVVPVKDIHRRASTSSENSIFMEVDTERYSGYRYYTINASGGEAAIAQSWLLHSLHEGLSHSRGGLADYLEDGGNVLLVLHCPDDQLLGGFLSEHPTLSVVARRDDYALLIE